MAIIRSVTIDHATLQRWVIRFVKLIDKEVRRDARAAKAFFRKVNIMVSLKSNSCALNSLNKSLAKDKQIEIRQIKYLNNIVEQDHRFIKKRTKPMLGFKSFNSAKITITGIENIRMIQKGQIIGGNSKLSVFENFAMLMA